MLGRGRCGRDVTGRRELEEKPEASRLRRGRGLSAETPPGGRGLRRAWPEGQKLDGGTEPEGIRLIERDVT